MSCCILSKRLHFRINHSFSINILKSYCSESLGLWNLELDESIKKNIEEHWKRKLKRFCYDPKDDKKQKFYVLSMFPYPSGKLHIGHVRVYTISDSIARFHRMLGKNVFHPMGWDAFGLPAENAAIERGVSADSWTRENIKTMKEQLMDLECCFDWDSELATCHPGYYKFTQDIFLRMYHAGLVHQKESLVNWDPVDKTVLADEQVDETGKSWRSGALVEKKPLRQWFIRTTKFAKSLYEGLDNPILENWRDITKIQKHWIGECNGAMFEFQITGSANENTLSVWTDKAEHLALSKFILLAPGSLLDRKYPGEVNRKLDIEAVNPITGERLPIYVAGKLDEEDPSVQAECRLGIPDASYTDREYARLFGIPVNESSPLLAVDLDERSRVCALADSEGYGGYSVSSNLRDWLISRQRHWGTPIPIIHCDACGHQPVPFEDLPVLLPADRDSSLMQQWQATKCPKCGKDSTRETDTMDTFVDSSWYYLRYADPRNEKSAFDKDSANKLVPVDIYVGGKEHAALHLYYARFVSHFLHSIGWLKEKEPFKRMLVQGMVMGKTFRVKGTGRYVKETEVEKKGKKLVEKETGAVIIEMWEKMSKSKHNGVDPKQMLNDYGVDSTRLLTLADVSPTSNRNWNAQTFPGVLKWQHRLWLTVREFQTARKNRESLQKSQTFDEQEAFIWDSRNFYLKGATLCYSHTHQLSVAISKMQGLTGSLRKSSKDVIGLSGEYERALAVQIVMLAPIAPHFASELWAGFLEAPGRINKLPADIDWHSSLVEQSWPLIDPHYKLDLNFLVNNKQRSSVKVACSELESLSKADAEAMALGDTTITSCIGNRPVVDVTYTLFPGCEANINFITQKSINKTENHDDNDDGDSDVVAQKA